MELFFDSLRWIHVAAGFTGLVAFWIPIFTRKGGGNHVLYGKVFKYCAYFVLGMAGLSIGLRVPLAFAEGVTPITHPQNFSFLVFLGYLTLVTYIGMRHGFGVLRYKADITRMNTGLNRGLAWTAIGSSVFLIAYAIIFSPPDMIVLYALSPIGFGTGFGILGAIKNKQQQKKAWFYEHMGAVPTGSVPSGSIPGRTLPCLVLELENSVTA